MKVTPDKMDTLALDWAVGQCEKRKLYLAKSKRLMTANYGEFNHRHGSPWYEPSSNWLQGGRIIQRVGIRIEPEAFSATGFKSWRADIPKGPTSPHGYKWLFGPTPLIAAMRCYVASDLGDEVELPPDIAEAYASDLARREKYMAQRARWLKKWAMEEAENEEMK